MTTIKYTKENWVEIFRNKYGMKMKDMNLNEFMLLKDIEIDICEIINDIRAEAFMEVIDMLEKTKKKHDIK